MRSPQARIFALNITWCPAIWKRVGLTGDERLQVGTVCTLLVPDIGKAQGQFVFFNPVILKCAGLWSSVRVSQSVSLFDL